MKKFFILLILAIGCTSRHAIKESTQITEPVTIRSESSDNTDAVLQILNEQRNQAEALIGEGSITLKESGSSQSGSFDLKSKRLNGGAVIDSLSMVISGPFGITAAKFLGSPEEYRFYNALEGDNYRGKPDPKALEQLTGMKGLTITALNNVLYGLAPNDFHLSTEDQATLQTISADEHLLYIKRQSFTETFALRGKFSETGKPTTLLVLNRYQRWNKSIDIAGTHSVAPDLVIKYEGKYSSEHFRLPNFIKIESRQKALEVEYTNATQNPARLTVKIKMPE